MEVEIPKYAIVEERSVKCPQCEKKFVNNEGVKVHLKCIHGNEMQKSDKNISTVVTKKPSVPDLVEKEVKNVVNDLIGCNSRCKVSWR